MEQPFYRRVHTYVRRAGRMSEGQRAAYDRLNSHYGVVFQNRLIDPFSLFAHDIEKIVIEIGFGMGDVTAKIAAAFPKTGFIGIEVHRPGVGKLFALCEEKGLQNVRVIEHDAVEVLEKMIPDGSIDGFHIFFPDPWPKKRHHKRRLIQDDNVKLVSRKLKPGGHLYCATDWSEYGDQMLDVLTSESLLVNRFSGFASRQSWRPETKFEKKGLKKSHPIKEVYFTRRERE